MIITLVRAALVIITMMMKLLLALKTEALVLTLIYRINYFLNLQLNQIQVQD
jgi:hypothetical protein